MQVLLHQTKREIDLRLRLVVQRLAISASASGINPH
jgi:hypothetical protein